MSFPLHRPSYAQRLVSKLVKPTRFAVYYLIQTETEDCIYVGVTCDPSEREIQHQCSERFLRLQVVCIVQGRAEGIRVEQALIRLQRRRGYELLNKTVGGEGRYPRKNLSVRDLSRVRTKTEVRQDKVAIQEMIRNTQIAAEAMEK